MAVRPIDCHSALAGSQSLQAEGAAALAEARARAARAAEARAAGAILFVRNQPTADLMPPSRLCATNVYGGGPVSHIRSEFDAGLAASSAAAVDMMSLSPPPQHHQGSAGQQAASNATPGLRTLLDMGVPEAQARSSLLAAGGDIMLAIEIATAEAQP